MCTDKSCKSTDANSQCTAVRGSLHLTSVKFASLIKFVEIFMLGWPTLRTVKKLMKQIKLHREAKQLYHFIFAITLSNLSLFE